jgi:catalase
MLEGKLCFFDSLFDSGMGFPLRASQPDIFSLVHGFHPFPTIPDYQLLEKLSQFDRERIPERVVHAQGYAAKGYFEVTHDITHLTCARVFSEVGKRTPVTTRFSTVIHPRGSSEGLRDPRGFSVKFYTEDGNWDLVGNNIPVFFVQDGMLFPDLIHALKPGEYRFCGTVVYHNNF